ncbi:MAG: hypothetical protein DWB42_14765 [Chloroflexi bacterium]|nr:hypothetical protein [Chloroflexota bacterium]MDL1885084.1 hypothetical protein [Anaerolineae bacterium CFX8]
MPDKTDKPARQEPQNWEHYLLWQNVVAALTRIPLYFQSAISVSGINATELYAFGNVLGLTIEQELVRTLNNLKSEWDAGNHYPHARFVR